MAVNGGSIPYEKYHGTGNDFIVVEERIADAIPDRRAFAIAHCDRRTGLGADGVLFVAFDDGPRPPRASMTLVQPDGSVAAMCGNGARCVARWALDRHAGRDPAHRRGRGTDGELELVIQTDDGPRHATAATDRATIEMGEPAFEPALVPVDRSAPMVREPLGGLEITAVNTGVPHAVAFVDDVGSIDLESVAPPIRYHDAFPEGANVTLATPRDDGGFDQRTYERGVEGETRSCGTGAVAIVAVGRRLGMIEGERFAVHPPGGRLEITVPDRGSATLTGPVVREGAGRLPAVPATGASE